MRVYDSNTRGLLTRPMTRLATQYMRTKEAREKRVVVCYNPKFDGEKRWVENISKGLRVYKAHAANQGIKHTGWFVDEWDATVHGLVVQLPARKDGTPKVRALQRKLYHSESPTEMYYPGVSDAWNDDCGVLDFDPSMCTSDLKQCARWADQMAQEWAEKELEYQRVESARIQQEEQEQENARENALEAGFAGLGVSV